MRLIEPVCFFAVTILIPSIAIFLLFRYLDAIHSVFDRIRLELWLFGAGVMWLAFYSANYPTGPIDQVIGNVVSTSRVKSGFELTLKFSDEEQVPIISSMPFPVGARIECGRQRARITKGYRYKCLVPTK